MPRPLTAPKSRQQFQNLRSHKWACTNCGWHFDRKFTQCPECDSTDVAYFASAAELKRWAHLRLGVRAGLYSNLRLQPEFPIEINGMKVTTYRADFSFVDLKAGKIVVEDVKGTTNEKYLDPVFKLKRKLVKAVYGLNITLVKV